MWTHLWDTYQTISAVKTWHNAGVCIVRHVLPENHLTNASFEDSACEPHLINRLINSSNILQPIEQCTIAITTWTLNVSLKFKYHKMDMHLKRALWELGNSLWFSTFIYSFLSYKRGITDLESDCLVEEKGRAKTYKDEQSSSAYVKSTTFQLVLQ